jgi:hypothetical protein
MGMELMVYFLCCFCKTKDFMVRTALLIVMILPLCLPQAVLAHESSRDPADGIFKQFSRHIQRQVEADKTAFAKASGCTNWFYQQEKHTPVAPKTQRIRLDLILTPPSHEECLRDYPGGLESVRQDFHLAQTSLSVSLTFYEYALVGDRDDDAHYSRQELNDLFQSLTLPFDPTHSTAVHVTALAERFDDWYRTRNLERVMNGMGELYEKGYRVTPADRVELDRVTK